MNYEGSSAFSLSKDDVVKIAKGMAIAAVAAGLTYVIDIAIPELQNRPGANASLFALISTVLNAARKFLFDTQKVVVALLIAALAISPCAGAAEIKLAPNSSHKATVSGIVTTDANGNPTFTLDPNSPITITGSGGTVVIPPPPPPPPGNLIETVKAATAAIPDYPDKANDRRAVAFGMNFLQAIVANVPVEQARATVKEFSLSAVGKEDEAKWAIWWATVDGKLNTLTLTPAVYSAAIADMATALTADLPATGEAQVTAEGDETYGLSPELIEALKKILIPLLMELLKAIFKQ